MHKYLEKETEISFDKIFNQILGKLTVSKMILVLFLNTYCNNYSLFAGYLLFKDFCENISEEPVPHLKFYEEVSLHFNSYNGYMMGFLWTFKNKYNRNKFHHETFI